MCGKKRCCNKPGPYVSGDVTSLFTHRVKTATSPQQTTSSFFFFVPQSDMFWLLDCNQADFASLQDPVCVVDRALTHTQMKKRMQEQCLMQVIKERSDALNMQ